MKEKIKEFWKKIEQELKKIDWKKDVLKDKRFVVLIIGILIVSFAFIGGSYFVSRSLNYEISIKAPVDKAYLQRKVLDDIAQKSNVVVSEKEAEEQRNALDTVATKKENILSEDQITQQRKVLDEIFQK